MIYLQLYLVTTNMQLKKIAKFYLQSTLYKYIQNCFFHNKSLMLAVQISFENTLPSMGIFLSRTYDAFAG